MATDREASLPIETWDGVNLNVDSEDILPNNLLLAENLWERTLGQLETRWPSITHGYKPDGVADNGLGNIFKLYKSWGEKNRFCIIKCEPDVSATSIALPTGVAISFVNDAGGYWNKDVTYGGGVESGITLNNRHVTTRLRFVGYGVDKFYEITTASISGYSSGTAQKLRIVIDPTFDNSKITGIEVYARVNSGDTETPATITTSSSYQLQTLWCGFVDVTTNINQTKDFKFCPGGYDATVSTTTTIGSSERSFVIRAYSSGNNNVSGTFVGGKTYYVAVLPQYTVFDGGTDTRCLYRNPTVDVFGGNVVPVTIPGTGTGYITVDTISPNTTCFLVAVGETPQTLQPLQIFNDSTGTGGASTAPNVAAPGTFWLETPPAHNPGVIDIKYTATGLATLQFRFSDFSRQDMILGINDDGTYYPIFCSRLFKKVNDDAEWMDQVSDLNTTPSSIAVWPWNWFSNNDMGAMQRMGNGNRYFYQAWQNYCVFVNDHDPLKLVSSGDRNVMPSRTSTNYFICDGAVAASVIEDYQATKVTLPNMKYITKFDNSIVLGGGTPSIDPENGGTNDSSKTVYFSRADNPFDFTIAGASSTTHQTIQVDDDGENISGFGIYTNTTSDQGPISQLVVTKKSATWIMNSLPTTSSGALTGFTNRLLSKKVGGFHGTIINTPIGTIMASHDNVYVLREDGEPTPIGQNIAPLIKASNMSKAVACYHDKHYKLSFSNPDYAHSQDGESNNVEMWLNINKVIEKKGAEDWVGPMRGRAVDFVLVEDKDGDGIAYNEARDRFCIDKYEGDGRIFIADSTPVSTDYVLFDTQEDADFPDEEDSEIVARLITKDLEVTAQDNNWTKLIKRFYVKCRTNWAGAVVGDATYALYVDGSTSGAVNFGTTIGNSAGAFYGKALSLVRVFPVGRLNGRTIKLDLTFTKRIGIGGLQVNYQINRRRL